MNKIFLIILFVPMFLVACGQNPATNQLKARKFNKLIDKDNAIILDVRTKNEFKNGHIKDAGQLNYYAMDFKKKLLLLPRNQPVYLYCNTGYRSDRAANILIKNGYTNIYNLEYGILEWNINNLPIIIEPDARPDLDNKFELKQYQALINSDSLVFIDFYAPWCAPCRKMSPMIDSLKLEYHNRINIVKINTDASKKLVKELKLLGVPYLVLYRKGQLLFSQNGMISKTELKETFDSQINND